jgi:hypothetical protein
MEGIDAVATIEKRERKAEEGRQKTHKQSDELNLSVFFPGDNGGVRAQGADGTGTLLFMGENV